MPAIPLQGDRSAWDLENYPERHASDLDTSTPIHHVPAPGTAGNVPVSDGTKWVSVPGNSIVEPVIIPPIMTLGTYEGVLQVGETPFRIFNRYGMDRQIIEVFLSVSTAPDGDDIIVDVKVGGVSIFDTGDAPKILDGQTTGYSVTILDPLWDNENYLTWEITQVGSTTPGSDLVVHIIHNESIGGS